MIEEFGFKTNVDQSHLEKINPLQVENLPTPNDYTSDDNSDTDDDTRPFTREELALKMRKVKFHLLPTKQNLCKTHLQTYAQFEKSKRLRLRRLTATESHIRLRRRTTNVLF